VKQPNLNLGERMGYGELPAIIQVNSSLIGIQSDLPAIVQLDYRKSAKVGWKSAIGGNLPALSHLQRQNKAKS
jgi:hypothetical protein